MKPFTHLLYISNTEVMLYVEIQRGKEPMTSEKYGKFAAAIGVTAAFVKRRVAATAHGGSKLSKR